MGVDFDVCAACGEVYADCEEYYTCTDEGDGCCRSYCKWRVTHRNQITFHMCGGSLRCTYCTPITSLREVNKDTLFEYALTQLELTEKQLRERYLTTETATDIGYCSRCDDSECANRATNTLSVVPDEWIQNSTNCDELIEVTQCCCKCAENDADDTCNACIRESKKHKIE